MTYYIVTVKLDKNPDHDPHNKVTGYCPVGGETGIEKCTDVTGQHHSLLVDAQSIDGARTAVAEGMGIAHITRIEEV